MVDPAPLSGSLGGPARPAQGGAPARLPTPPSPPAGTASFADVLRAAVREVDSLQRKSDEMKQSLAVNPNANLQEVMIATEEARLAFEFTMQVRNKVVQAYEELMRLQI